MINSVRSYFIYNLLRYFLRNLYFEYSISKQKNSLKNFLLLSLLCKAESLKKLCQTREQEIQECRQKIEEAWALAKDEAAKTKAAKEVIKALTSRVKLILLTELINIEIDHPCNAYTVLNFTF